MMIEKTGDRKESDNGREKTLAGERDNLAVGENPPEPVDRRPEPTPPPPPPPAEKPKK